MQILTGEFWPCDDMVILACVYIKAWVFKNDKTEMTTATNVACIEWLHKNC